MNTWQRGGPQWLLTESEQQLMRYIAEAGHAAYMATLVGYSPPIVQKMGERMRDPRPGDLVLETSTFYNEPWRPSGLGRLVAVRDEPIMGRVEFCEMHLDGGWYDDPDETYPDFAVANRDRYTYLAPICGEGGPCLHRWYNASFIALPVAHLAKIAR